MYIGNFRRGVSVVRDLVPYLSFDISDSSCVDGVVFDSELCEVSHSLNDVCLFVGNAMCCVSISVSEGVRVHRVLMLFDNLDLDGFVVGGLQGDKPKNVVCNLLVFPVGEFEQFSLDLRRSSRAGFGDIFEYFDSDRFD